MAMAIAPTVRPASMRDHSPGSQALDDTPRGYAWLNNSPTPLKPTKRRNVTKATTGPELCTVSFEPKYRDSRRKQYDEARVGSLRGKTIGWESWSKRLVATSDAMDMEE
ncbi:hypothetical protein FRB97_003061 [Tulasnella sp. 331]|nr:hypothetical protein FRB97_003061 [Tulasnella sp. 331]KAG8890112.1 hypothetical protein FRB98_000840 [Tulasnella sp. 332]